MTNLERLKMEIKGIDTPETELEVYLMENDLTHSDEYDATSNSNKKKIYQTALSILESLANNPSMMKNYKTEDISITHFHTNLLSQIDNLNRKIRSMLDDSYASENDATWIYMFK
ncbi:hypothetical protein AAK964_04980 [Tissierella praeacuta]|uniref:hypothetical protein n=1 Tax=Tissierella praeacuta TaxID=43131 RepID=UPI003511EC36